VPSSAIDNEQGDRAGADALTDFRQMHAHDVGVDGWHDQGGAGAACGTNRTKQIGPGKAAVTLDPRTRATFGPEPTYRALLADPGFILEPDFNRAPGAFRRDRSAGQIGEVFLKASCACGSLCGCWGRPDMLLKSSFFQKFANAPLMQDDREAILDTIAQIGATPTHDTIFLTVRTGLHPRFYFAQLLAGQAGLRPVRGRSDSPASPSAL